MDVNFNQKPYNPSIILISMEQNIRQPIVTVVGHVDHGKTSILDKLRQSSVQSREAGGITQKISFTLYPMSDLKAACPLIDESGMKINLPGFLFIDTPGHAAFTNLRKRGGSLADLAVLVIDVNEGIKPQTAEVIQILQHNKTPFLIALNKIDNISGWQTSKEKGLKESIESQSTNVKQNFQEKYMTLIGSLQSHGFDSDLFYNINDFSKKVALVPCSAETGEGIQELIMVLCGISQKYLSGKLTLNKEESAKGVILEVKKEKDQNYLESILYNGQLNKNDEIAIADLDGNAHLTKIRVLEEIMPLSDKFQPVKNAKASTGLRMQITSKIDISPGMPFQVHEDNLEEIKKDFQKEISGIMNLDKQGIIAKADSLGSLEALLLMLKQNNIRVVKAGIGKISKTDIISARANLEINKLDSVVVGFNTSIDDEAEEFMKSTKSKDESENIRVITDDVVYKLIEDLIEFREKKAQEIEKERLMSLASLTKLKVLHEYVFRNTSPAIFGVRVEAGALTQGIELIDQNGEKVGRVKKLQSENKSVDEAKEGLELAISIPGVNFERRMKDVTHLYSNISKKQFRHFKKNKDLLSQSEIKALQEINQIKDQSDKNWSV